MLYENIKENIKVAMRDKNNTLKDVLKQVQMKAQAFAKENKVDIDDNIIIDSINKELKQLNQTLDLIKDKTETDLYKTTVEKIDILKAYLPKQLNKEQIKEEIEKILSENSDTPKGKLTGIVMKTLKGKANNKDIKDVLDSLLK